MSEYLQYPSFKNSLNYLNCSWFCRVKGVSVTREFRAAIYLSHQSIPSGFQFYEQQTDFANLHNKHIRKDIRRFWWLWFFVFWNKWVGKIQVININCFESALSSDSAQSRTAFRFTQCCLGLQMPFNDIFSFFFNTNFSAGFLKLWFSCKSP